MVVVRNAEVSQAKTHFFERGRKMDSGLESAVSLHTERDFSVLVIVLLYMCHVFDNICNSEYIREDAWELLLSDLSRAAQERRGVVMMKHKWSPSVLFLCLLLACLVVGLGGCSERKSENARAFAGLAVVIVEDGDVVPAEGRIFAEAPRSNESRALFHRRLEEGDMGSIIYTEATNTWWLPEWALEERHQDRLPRLLLDRNDRFWMPTTSAAGYGWPVPVLQRYRVNEREHALMALELNRTAVASMRSARRRCASAVEP